MHQTRSSGKTGAGLPIFIHDSLTYCIRQDLNINNHDSEALCIETINNKGKKILISTQYRQPAGKYNKCKTS